MTMRAESDTEHYTIALDPFNPENIFIGTNTVWKSLDGGGTWIRTGLDQRVFDMAFDESNGYLYAATYGSGVVFTKDGGETWEFWGDLPANPYLHSIDVGERDDGSIIYAGSFGTGVFEWSEKSTSIHSLGGNELPPENSTLMQNYPNPFNSETQIEYSTVKSGHITLRIFNLLGQTVKTLLDKEQCEGYYSVVWNGKDDRGRSLASGIYYYCLKVEERIITKKLVLLR